MRSQTKPSLGRTFTGFLLCPGFIYFVTLALFCTVDLWHGRPWHLFVPRYFFPLVMVHQWSPETIASFYVICGILVVPVIAIIGRVTRGRSCSSTTTISEMTATPNHALQRTGSAVTAPAADHRRAVK